MRYKPVICLVLITITLAVFWQVREDDFIRYDDPEYVTDNPHVNGGLNREAVVWAFTAYHAGNWHPVTWLSHMADCQAYDLKPGGHHLTSLFLHVASTVLLFLLLARMTGAVWQSSFVAALFALHPLHVESVAWIAERKDVLSGFFWMLTLMLYAGYVKRPGRVKYLLTLCAFALGLMAKPMLVTLPCVLLLLDYWPLGRFGAGRDTGESAAWSGQDPATPVKRLSLPQLVLEKAPFFALSLASSIVTFHAQREGGAVVSVAAVPFDVRLVNALTSYLRYLGKMIWPSNLAVIYPLSPAQTLWHGVGAVLVLAVVSFLVLRAARRYPFLPVGWLWYLGTLVPVIGLVQVGHQSMADRYTYIPLIGLFIMISWGVPCLVQGRRWRQPVLAISALLAISASASLTWLQLGYWRNGITLFSHAIAVVPDNFVAHTSLGTSLAMQGRLDEAVRQFSEALRIRPADEEAHLNLGLALAEQGKTEEADVHFAEVLRKKPDQLKAHMDLGAKLAKLGRFEAAAHYYAAAVTIAPGSAEAHYTLGMTLGRMGNFAEAARQISDAVRIRPDFAEGHYNLGVALLQMGRSEEAADQFREALRIEPGFAAARQNLESVLQPRTR